MATVKDYVGLRWDIGQAKATTLGFDILIGRVIGQISGGMTCTSN